MNERIKELYLTAMREDSGEKWDTQEEFIERFAQLIVRECANRIDYWESRQGEHSDDLLKHFGVESDQMVLAQVYAAHWLQKSLVLSYQSHVWPK